MANLQRELEKCNLAIPFSSQEPLAPYTTFRVGGPAEVLAQPSSEEEAAQLIRISQELKVPLTVLGGGANVVISDRGLRGIVLHTGRLNRISQEGDLLRAETGTSVSTLAAAAADRNLAGLAFIYGMPGSVGGAVWMNARCYGGEISHVLKEVSYLALTGSQAGTPGVYTSRPEDFSYKRSPFQEGSRLITGATFALHRGERSPLWEEMRRNEEDRRAKGHFEAPCAGSIFKNNRDFGAPSGQIIDEVGLRGLQRGGALVSPRHGNIIINTGNARAREIRDLVLEVQSRVHQARGILLEPEVLFLGD
ncbi:UDP-N-acetylmuramate dehydrogenase [Alkalispirochaeta americana]|uniref:UDP-N-acetylenolpyruvoylglucosamine reductase n=1 Tax=Alkalispirochaeta americana TaxID=159291 RepID=A0A1N6N7G6_9SPIO|nr:UDP-N-acetylmuramate dehydrogenase [Alkalispirochaeta americana]SIP88008.1 UDP-N-acetylmuramate dehydrogenase [Alkalispirochaeta americana]